MEEVYVVRHRHLVEGVPIRQIAREMGIDRNTVRRYLRGAPAGVGKPRGEAGAPVRAAVEPRAIEILEDSKRWTEGKQRLTAARLYTMLVGEKYDVGYTVVKQIVREWRRRRKEVFVPLVYKPGDLGEVDFFEVFVEIGGERRKAHMFVMRLMHSGRDFAWLYPRQDQTCFLDGHVRAFAHLGAVPHRLVYDNLKAAVRKILVGSERELAARFLAIANHYLFEPCFRAKDMTRVVSSRAAKRSAGRSWFRFRRVRISGRSAQPCLHGSTRARRSASSRSNRGCYRYRRRIFAPRSVCRACRCRAAVS
jgi:transposase